MTLTVIKFGGGYNRMEKAWFKLQGDQTNPS